MYSLKPFLKMPFNNFNSIKTWEENIFGSTSTGSVRTGIIVFLVIFVQLEVVTHPYPSKKKIKAT